MIKFLFLLLQHSYIAVDINNYSLELYFQYDINFALLILRSALQTVRKFVFLLSLLGVLYMVYKHVMG